jgi:hypothetical protein
MTRTNRLGLFAGALALLLLAAPALAAPARDAELPTDRPIVATVVKIDEAAGSVMLATPHGDVALSMAPELAGQLTVGDVVVVRFTDEDDFPAASPREAPSDERSTGSPHKI